MTGRIVSHYKILEKLGEGGMGKVFLAEDTKLERKVALKFLPAGMTSNKEARKRFQREAKAAAALNHPNIVTIYEIDEFEGQIYIAMEYVEGGTLDETALSLLLNDVIEVALQVCEGLEDAHGAGIIHRDIKLENILLDRNNRVKILDFGLAKLKEGGTASYMSPEQARAKETDHRTDIWSLGVVLYRMVTGQAPFPGENEPAVIRSIINHTPLPPTQIRDNIPAGMERLILKCLRKNPTHRYPSVTQLAADLSTLRQTLRGEKPKIPPGQTRETGPGKESERRWATVIAAKISGYGETRKGTDTEVVVSIVGCVEELGAIVEKYGGRPGKFVGNSFVAYFGVPTAVEDAPKNAVNAAIEMRNRLNRLASFGLRAGINTGVVIAGDIGAVNGEGKKSFSDTYHVMGNTVNVAFQLVDQTAKGQVLVGPLTYRYTAAEFEYKELEPMLSDNKSEATAVYELLSTKERIFRPGFGPERMIYSEMVGREKEFDKLKLHLLKAINGEGSIISVTGESGIGKSRLLDELIRTEDIKKVMLLEGRALSIGKNLSYHPIIDSLKNLANIKDEDSETGSLYKLEQAIANIYPEGTAEVFPFVATLMGMKLKGKHAERVHGIEGEAMEKLIRKNMRELLRKGGERRPIVFIIHDIHWADISSIELMESLFRLAESHAILFIVVMRPNYLETGERVLETIRDRYPGLHTQIRTEPLDEAQCKMLIRNLVKARSFPARIIDLITKRAEGNPFFIEEVLRSFIDEGAVRLKDGTFEITEKIDSVDIPETIQDVLMARIDRLDEETKKLLKKASVIGRYFFYKILTEVAEAVKDIDGKLEYLKEIQFIGERVRLEEIEYLFSHALAHEVTYESILTVKRKALHLDVADAIESVFSGRLYEFYGMLALHYSRGENLPKAEEYLIKAGEEALRAAASNEALSYYREALKLYLKKTGDAADPGKIAMLEINIALAFYNKGRMAEAVNHFDKVLEYGGMKQPKKKVTALFRVITGILNIIKHLYLPSIKVKRTPGNRDNEIFDLSVKRGFALSTVDSNRMFIDSIGLLSRLIKLDITKVENGVSICISGSALFSLTGISFAISKKILDYAGNHLKEHDIRTTIMYKWMRLIHDSYSGAWDKDFKYDLDLVDRNLDIGEIYNAGGYTMGSGLFEIERGNFSVVQICIDKLDEMGNVYENDHNIGRMHFLKTKQLFKRRKLYDALEQLDAGVSFLLKIGQGLFAFFLRGIKPYIHILLNDIGEAEISLARVKELVAHEKRELPLYLCNFLMSQFLFDLYMLEECIHSQDKNKITQLRKKVFHSGKAAIKNANKYALDGTEAFRLMGSYYWLIGKQKNAFAWWHKSIQTAGRLGARLELARTYTEVGKRMLEKKNGPPRLNGIPAQEYLEKARRLFKDMDLAWDLDRVDKIISRAPPVKEGLN
jgi:class 3 adenylate cyclase/predicted Ser/Thr protein kinase/tetratricopeptide (TPR) repeat protein